VVVDRATFQAELDLLRLREKAHTREGDAIAAVRRRLPMVEVDPTITLIGPHGPVTLLEVFEGRRQLIAYYFMWGTGRPAVEQCEGCTFLLPHSRDVTYATFCRGPYDESVRYRDFMGWEMPWYSAQGSLDALFTGRPVGMILMVCYLRHGDRVFETYWTTGRGVDLKLMDLLIGNILNSLASLRRAQNFIASVSRPGSPDQDSVWTAIRRYDASHDGKSSGRRQFLGCLLGLELLLNRNHARAAVVDCADTVKRLPLEVVHQVVQREVVGRSRHVTVGREEFPSEVDMDIDQRGHDGLARQIDARGAARRINRSFSPDGGNHAILHHERSILDWRAQVADDQAGTIVENRSL
jgi:hypothetical protein